MLTITNDDTNVQFSAATYTGVEGGAATLITINRSGVISGSSTVTYMTSDGSATALDYTSTTGSVTFAAAETTKTFSVPSLNDLLVEGDETVNLALSAPSTATLGTQSTAVLTLTDDDASAAGVMQFSAATYAQAELNSGTSTVTVTVTRTSGTTGTVGVTWATSNGTAADGSDYTAATGVLTYLGGESFKTFTVTIAGDTTAEVDETINLTLSLPTGGTVIGTQATATIQITNDDGPVVAPPAAAPPDEGSKCSSGLAFVLLSVLAMLLAGGGLVPRPSTTPGTAPHQKR